MCTQDLAHHALQPGHHVQRAILAAVMLALPAATVAQCGWEALGSGEPGSGPDNDCRAFAEFEGDLYVGGAFQSVGGVPGTKRVARWNGAQWESVGGGETSVSGSVSTLVVIDGELWAGGPFQEMGGVPGTWGIAKWDGRWWSSLDGGFGDGLVNAIVEFEGDVYVGGDFNRSVPGPRAVARWDGIALSQVGDLGASAYEGAQDLIVFDDGSGPALYAGLNFPIGDDARVAKWDGETWTPVGHGMISSESSSYVSKLAIFDGDLYACGSFQGASDQPGTWGIARWNGGSWVSVGGGVTSSSGPFGRALLDMEVFDDGSGPALFIAGTFESVGGVAIGNIAKWDGQAWSAPTGGVPDNEVFDLASIGGRLYAGGPFASVGGVPAAYVARWSCEGSGPCYADLDGDGMLTIFDFLAFQNAFDAGDMAADCDADGDLTLFDFLCFQNAFDAGCE